jgi:hypothetical protein
MFVENNNDDGKNNRRDLQNFGRYVPVSIALILEYIFLWFC